jgi:hypothetical protein
MAPTLIGAGTEAVGDLRINRVVEGIQLRGRYVRCIDDDVIAAFDVAGDAGSDRAP